MIRERNFKTVKISEREEPLKDTPTSYDIVMEILIISEDYYT